MRTKRIELEGNAGHVAIERENGSTMIRIDSIVREPKNQQAWMTLHVDSSDVSDDELFKIAEIVQRLCDGVVGTNSDIHDYYRELQRFAG